jgi:hypothetical protein
MQRVPSQAIQKGHQIHHCTACDLFQFCREVILDLIESKSEMIGGEGKVVETMKVSSVKENITVVIM